MIQIPDAQQAAAAFCRDGATCRVVPLGSGNINHTFLVHSMDGPFVLQRINRTVFPEPVRVIENFFVVSSHLRQRQHSQGNRFSIAEPRSTLSGNTFFRDSGGEYWRSQSYLEHTCCRSLTSPQQAVQIGRALARFHQLIADLDGRRLADPLPGFHCLPQYLREYDGLQPSGRGEKDGDCGYCRLAVETHRLRALHLESQRSAGLLPVQPIHGDPKIDNFIFNREGLAEGMLDLDTVGMGIVHYDLGDCLRSCCNVKGENGGDSGAVSFDPVICTALLTGYFSLPSQAENTALRTAVFDAVLAITFELGLRFFTDHLCGNSYFKVRRQGENLTRAVRQFHLVEAIVAQEERIRSLALSAGR